MNAVDIGCKHFNINPNYINPKSKVLNTVSLGYDLNSASEFCQYYNSVDSSVNPYKNENLSYSDYESSGYNSINREDAKKIIKNKHNPLKEENDKSDNIYDLFYSLQNFYLPRRKKKKIVITGTDGVKYSLSGKKIGRPRIDRSNTRCFGCSTSQTPQWRYITFSDILNIFNLNEFSENDTYSNYANPSNITYDKENVEPNYSNSDELNSKLDSIYDMLSHSKKNEWKHMFEKCSSKNFSVTYNKIKICLCNACWLRFYKKKKNKQIDVLEFDQNKKNISHETPEESNSFQNNFTSPLVYMPPNSYSTASPESMIYIDYSNGLDKLKSMSSGESYMSSSSTETEIAQCRNNLTPRHQSNLVYAEDCNKINVHSTMSRYFSRNNCDTYGVPTVDYYSKHIAPFSNSPYQYNGVKCRNIFSNIQNISPNMSINNSSNQQNDDCFDIRNNQQEFTYPNTNFSQSNICVKSDFQNNQSTSFDYNEDYALSNIIDPNKAEQINIVKNNIVDGSDMPFYDNEAVLKIDDSGSPIVNSNHNHLYSYNMNSCRTDNPTLSNNLVYGNTFCNYISNGNTDDMPLYYDMNKNIQSNTGLMQNT